MQSGELARAAGMNTKTVRYYEAIGVLPPADRASNGYRIYDQVAVDRLRFIREAQATGLTLEEIISVLELRGRGASTCRHVVGLLEHHLDELNAHQRPPENETGTQGLDRAGKHTRPVRLYRPHPMPDHRPSSPAAHRSGAELHGAPGAHRH